MGSRVIWSAKAASKAASDSISSKVNESLSSLTSMDEDEYYMNPNDPTRVSACYNMLFVANCYMGGSKAASDKISSKVNECFSSLTSMDKDENYMNPNDPTRVSACYNMLFLLHGLL
jgi:hypothetical protein